VVAVNFRAFIDAFIEDRIIDGGEVAFGGGAKVGHFVGDYIEGRDPVTVYLQCCFKSDAAVDENGGRQLDGGVR